MIKTIHCFDSNKILCLEFSNSVVVHCDDGNIHVLQSSVSISMLLHMLLISQSDNFQSGAHVFTALNLQENFPCGSSGLHIGKSRSEAVQWENEIRHWSHQSISKIPHHRSKLCAVGVHLAEEPTPPPPSPHLQSLSARHYEVSPSVPAPHAISSGQVT